MQEMNVNPNAQQSWSISSVVYNGNTMKKIELMVYLRNVILLKKEIDENLQQINERKKEISVLELEKERRPIRQTSYMEKPTGLLALFPSQKRAYEKWLLDAPKREREKQALEKAETERVKEVQEKYNLLVDKNFDHIHKTTDLVNKYNTMLEQHIIAPEYREEHIMQTILLYLFENRAQTYAEAINIYREEEHRNKMQYLAEEQLRQSELARREQQELAWQQIQMQQERFEQIARELEETKKVAKDAKFFSELDFWINL